MQWETDDIDVDVDVHCKYIYRDSGLKTGGDDIDDSDGNEYAIDEDGDFIDEYKDLNI